SNKPRTIVFGYDRLLLDSLETLGYAGAEIVLVVFPATRADGRATEIREEVRARRFKIVEQPRKESEEGFAGQLNALEPDLVFVWSYPMILPREVIEIPRLGCINLHM